MLSCGPDDEPRRRRLDLEVMVDTALDKRYRNDILLHKLPALVISRVLRGRVD